MADPTDPHTPARTPWNLDDHAREGTRFATPEEFRAAAASRVFGLLRPYFIDALADAADDDGVLLDFEERDFFEQHLVPVFTAGLDDDPPAITYDLFTVMTLKDVLHSLASDGLLAQRGNGDSADYRLTLPVHVDDVLARA